MDFLSAAQAAERWNVSPRQVQRLLAAGRISGATKYGKAWMIPADARKPADPRRAGRTALSAELAWIVAESTKPMPPDDPDAVLSAVTPQRVRLQYEGELAYLRGDFESTLRCFAATDGDDAARLRACPVAIAAAISLGDYRAYSEMETYLKAWVQAAPGGNITSIAEQALDTAAVSAIAPDMVHDWLKRGDLDGLQLPMKVNALYLRAKYLLCDRRFDAALAVAQTALAFSLPSPGITVTDLYLRSTCAVACFHMGRADEAKRWLLNAMRIAVPHGMLTPFAEIVTALGGLVEECLNEEFPEVRNAVIAQWQKTWKNWIAFHNQFTKDNITTILTLREYHIACLAVRHVSYAQIAAQYHISVGRLKNIMLGIYRKLLISGREELSKYIL